MERTRGFTLVEVLVSLALLGLALVGLDYLQLQFLSFNRASEAVHQAVQVSRAISAYQFNHLTITVPFDWQAGLVQGRFIHQDEDAWAITWGGFEGEVCTKAVFEVRGCIPPLTQLDLRSLN